MSTGSGAVCRGESHPRFEGRDLAPDGTHCTEAGRDMHIPANMVTALVGHACCRRECSDRLCRRWVLGTGGTILGPGVPKTSAKGAKHGGGESVLSACCCCCRRWRVAHSSGGQGVAGSNPASPTMHKAARSGRLLRSEDRGAPTVGVGGPLCGLHPSPASVWPTFPVDAAQGLRTASSR
jgi:hypothetical protein